MSIHLAYTIVNAFTKEVFRGNPAAVIVLDEGTNLDDYTLQLIAREFNLSETAYVKCRGEVGNDPTRKSFGLRWFTPNTEYALCGHATIAATHVISQMTDIVPENIRSVMFDTISGALTAEILTGGRIRLELPAGETTRAEKPLEIRVKEIVKKAMGKDGPNIHFVGVGSGLSFGKYVLIEVDESFNLSSAVVNANPFLELAPDHCVFMFTSETREQNVTFISRVFGPAFGVNEDPVCGSAHGMLGPYWQQKLDLAVGTRMLAHQVSERGGFVEVSWSKESRTCSLTGEAVTAMKGDIFL